MHNTASLLLLVFLAITFIQSAYDKIFYWKDNVSWLKEHFSKTTLKNQVPLALAHVLILELIWNFMYRWQYRTLLNQWKTLRILRRPVF